MDFEDDPNYEDEDEDNIYDFAQERDKSLNKYIEPVEEDSREELDDSEDDEEEDEESEEDISYEKRASPDI